jgi:hypothetical protein
MTCAGRGFVTGSKESHCISGKAPATSGLIASPEEANQSGVEAASVAAAAFSLSSFFIALRRSLSTRPKSHELATSITSLATPYTPFVNFSETLVGPVLPLS